MQNHVFLFSRFSIVLTCCLFGAALTLTTAGCQNKTPDATNAASVPVSGTTSVGAPAAAGATPAAMSAVDLQRIQNDPNMTPQQKSDAIARFRQSQK